MAVAFGYFTSWWFWLFAPIVLVLFCVLLFKICLDFPRLLCCGGCEEEQPEKLSHSVEEVEEEEEQVPVTYRSIG